MHLCGAILPRPPVALRAFLPAWTIVQAHLRSCAYPDIAPLNPRSLPCRLRQITPRDAEALQFLTELHYEMGRDEERVRVSGLRAWARSRPEGPCWVAAVARGGV